MTQADSLYAELKPDVQTIAAPLMDFGEQQVRKNGGFLPFGATLTQSGEVALQAAMPERDPATSDDVLPLVMQGLEVAAGRAGITAVAVAEWVKIAEPGQELRDAIKVQVHHRRGLAVTLYTPATKRLLRGWNFGETIARAGEALIKSW